MRAKQWHYGIVHIPQPVKTWSLVIAANLVSNDVFANNVAETMDSIVAAGKIWTDLGKPAGKKAMRVLLLLSSDDDSDDDNVEENTVANGDAWCNNLISQFKKFPPHMSLTFGGYYNKVWTALDEKFLQEDIANLAMLSYKDPIRDGSFFPDEGLLVLYFKNTVNPRAIFKKLFGI